MRYLMRLFYTVIQNGQCCFGVGAKMARSKYLHTIYFFMFYKKIIITKEKLN